MYGVRNSSWNPTLFVFPNKNSDLRMKEREILRRRGLMKSHMQTYTLHLMLLSLSMPLFFSFHSDFAVCVYIWLIFTPIYRNVTLILPEKSDLHFVTYLILVAIIRTIPNSLTSYFTLLIQIWHGYKAMI